MKKRILSIILTISMLAPLILSNIPINVSAAEDEFGFQTGEFRYASPITTAIGRDFPATYYYTDGYFLQSSYQVA